MAKKKSYVYKLVSKCRKHPELLLNYGFQFYTDENNEEKIFAYPVKLAEDHPLFLQCVHFLEYCYEHATTKEREEDFKDYEFVLELQPDQSNKWRLVLTDAIKKEFEVAQLCVSLNKYEQDSGFLFINSPIQNAYYHYKTIDECAGEIITKLLKDKMIYRRSYMYKEQSK